jgi:hypothetical protein
VLCAVEEIDFVIDFLDFDNEDYDFEYGLTLSTYDDEIHLGIEKAECGDGKYKLFDLDYVYISEDCGEELKERNIKHVNNVKIFTIDGSC